MAARVYVTEGPRGAAGWLRFDQHGIMRVTGSRRWAERFSDARGAEKMIPFLEGIGWSGEVRDEGV